MTGRKELTLAALIILFCAFAQALPLRGDPVNLNTASARQLEGLPGIGPALAQRIIDHRQENGPFKRIEDLMNVRGIGEKKFLQLEELITVDGQPSKKKP